MRIEITYEYSIALAPEFGCWAKANGIQATGSTWEEAKARLIAKLTITNMVPPPVEIMEI